MSTRSRILQFHIHNHRSILFFVALSLAISYIFFAIYAVALRAETRRLSEETSEIRVELAQYEQKYFELADTIDMREAQELGLVDASKNIRYINSEALTARLR